MGARVTSDASAPLLRHRERRAQGLPTVTVLAGDRRVASWLWRTRHTADCLPPVISAAVERDALIDEWLGSLRTIAEVHAAMLQSIADAEGTSATELLSQVGSRGPWQLEQLAERHAGALGLDATTVLRAFGLTVEAKDQASNARWPKEVATLLGKLPSLLIVPEFETAETLRRAAKTLGEVAEAVPSAEVGLAVEPGVVEGLLLSLPDRLSSMLVEGLVLLKPRHAPVVSTIPRAPFLEFDPDQFARSRAELRLFEMLATRERTRGLFQLNKTVGPLDDGSSLEVDLVSETLRVAVEVDGYHHFRDATGYRRDRRKDLRLQDLGYFVVRVLASDVEDELEHVLEIIDLAVERRRKRLG
jgi:very-short-patch-repair endonuclease